MNDCPAYELEWFKISAAKKVVLHTRNKVKNVLKKSEKTNLGL